MYNVKFCKSCPSDTCHDICEDMEIIHKCSIPRTIRRENKNSESFYKVLNVNDVFNVFYTRNDLTYMINGGNTAHGNKKKSHPTHR